MIPIVLKGYEFSTQEQQAVTEQPGLVSWFDWGQWVLLGCWLGHFASLRFLVGRFPPFEAILIQLDQGGYRFRCLEASPGWEHLQCSILKDVVVPKKGCEV